MMAASEGRASAEVAMSRLRVIVADEHPLIRIGLREFLTRLSDEVDIVEAKSLEDALQVLDEKGSVDLMITDLVVQAMRGFDGLRQIHQKAPELPVVVLSVTDSAHDVRSAIEAGAMGFIPKTSSPEVMVNALKLVLSGGVYLPPNVLRGESGRGGAAVGGSPGGMGEAALSHLTPRQQEVLALLAQGKTNKQIANELGLAAGTVKVHMSRILKALNVHNRTQAVIAASQVAKSGQIDSH